MHCINNIAQQKYTIYHVIVLCEVHGMVLQFNLIAGKRSYSAQKHMKRLIILS